MSDSRERSAQGAGAGDEAAAAERHAANVLMLKKLGVVVLMMFGFGFALVPFYEKICQVTGINDLMRPDVVTNTQVDASRTIRIEFDSNARVMPLQFRALEFSKQVHPGEVGEVVYEVVNRADRPVVAQAIPSYGPQRAGQYFRKLECFCFTAQRLEPGEARKMPVVFVIDPALPADVQTITLSYTFFEVDGATKG